MPRFSAKLLEYFEEPRNEGAMAIPDRVGRASWLAGAPTVTIYLRIAGDRVVAATFKAAGCGVTIAAASVLTELVEGRSLAECARLTPQELIEALDGLPADKHYCAAVALSALRGAIATDVADHA